MRDRRANRRLRKLQAGRDPWIVRLLSWLLSLSERKGR